MLFWAKPGLIFLVFYLWEGGTESPWESQSFSPVMFLLVMAVAVVIFMFVWAKAPRLKEKENIGE